jgi:type VI secretion system secreted protein Hcp
MPADMFLKIEGIQGESEDSKHKNEIEVLSWSWGETQTGSSGRGTGAGTGKVDMQDINFSKFMDKASPKLFMFCATGKHIPTVEFVGRKAGGDQQEYLKIKLNDVLVSSFTTSNSSGSNTLPVESFSLNFSKIEFEYFQQKADGSVASAGKHGYDLKANKAS